MSELEWIRELIESEQKNESQGMVDQNIDFLQSSQNIEWECIQFLGQLKDLFIDYTTVYNKLRDIPTGGIKIYGISKTKADFMLFRNGYKLIFSLKKLGIISIRMQHQGSEGVFPSKESSSRTTHKEENDLYAESLVEARLGPFDEVIWTHQEQPVKIEKLVRFFFTRFIRESL